MTKKHPKMTKNRPKMTKKRCDNVGKSPENCTKMVKIPKNPQKSESSDQETHHWPIESHTDSHRYTEKSPQNGKKCEKVGKSRVKMGTYDMDR